MVTNKKRIQAYIDLSTYESLMSQAKDRNISLSKLASEILQAHSMVDNFSESVSDDYSCFVKDELTSMLEELRCQIISEIGKLKVQNEGLSNFKKTDESSSKNQKKKRKGFGK